jgi:hypothetical protein
VVWAAALRDPAAVWLLLDLGWAVDALGRHDSPEGGGHAATALHVAAANADEPMVRLLLAAGADPTVRDWQFHATPQGWAEHFGHNSMARLLATVVASRTR